MKRIEVNGVVVTWSFTSSSQPITERAAPTVREFQISTLKPKSVYRIFSLIIV